MKEENLFKFDFSSNEDENSENPVSPHQSVKQITQTIKDSLQKNPQLFHTSVIGEITDYNKNSFSGHIYFTLADKDSLNDAKNKVIIKCTFFKFRNASLNFTPKAGMEVILFGSISVYAAGGSYSFNVDRMQQAGQGQLLLRLQQLRAKLIQEKIIDPDSRKRLPILPRRVAIVTGINTAALRDIFKQIVDRFPKANILVAPCKVQGVDAPQSIANAIAEISKEKYGCDVIIVGRGGGSQEDLMAFNDEIVARAIFACDIPIISGVGHQVDHQISDDVADVSAATPTDAAKIAFPEVASLRTSLNQIKNRLNLIMESRITILRQRLNLLADKPFYREPQILINDYYLRIDENFSKIEKLIYEKLTSAQRKFDLVANLDMLWSRIYENKKNIFLRNQERLIAFSPLATLKRGYSIVYQDNNILTSNKRLKKGDALQIHFSDGKTSVVVEN